MRSSWRRQKPGISISCHMRLMAAIRLANTRLPEKSRKPTAARAAAPLACTVWSTISAMIPRSVGRNRATWSSRKLRAASAPTSTIPIETAAMSSGGTDSTR